MTAETYVQKSPYEQDFRLLQESQLDSRPWLVHLRENAMARFEDLGFPSTKDEEWKYTNVTSIARTDFTTWRSTEFGDSGSGLVELAAFSAPEARDSQLVFVDDNCEMISLH
jgi:hypothetical protein